MAIHSIDAEDDQFAYRYDTQLLIERRDEDLDEDEISDYITEHFEGNSLIAAGDDDPPGKRSAGLKKIFMRAFIHLLKMVDRRSFLVGDIVECFCSC